MCSAVSLWSGGKFVMIRVGRMWAVGFEADGGDCDLDVRLCLRVRNWWLIFNLGFASSLILPVEAGVLALVPLLFCTFGAFE